MNSTAPVGVHMVGSAPFETPEDLFRTVGRGLGSHLERMPDGEPGERAGWIGWQFGFLAASPLLETKPGQLDPGRPEVTLKEGADPADLHFDDLGYAAAAAASYEKFVAAKAAGDVPPHVRFQVCLPTPLDVLSSGMATFESRGLIEPAYEAAMLHEVEKICAAIPNDQLAIQWDLAQETLLWEQDFERFDNHVDWWRQSVAQSYWGGHDGIVRRALRMIDAVPATVQTGVHLCYGDFMGKHEVQPKDLSNAVELANALLEGAERPIAWVHMPVPIDRSDAAYFAALADLRLPEGTKLFLGLLHLTDGESGAAQRIAAARTVASDFGVATECGWGRRAPKEAPELVRLHAAVSAPIAGR